MFCPLYYHLLYSSKKIIKRWEDEENPQDCLVSQVLNWGNTWHFFIQMEKRMVCKEGIIKFKAINSSDTMVVFFQIMNDTIKIF